MTTIILLPVDAPAPIGPACAGDQRVAPTYWTPNSGQTWNGTAWDLPSGGPASMKWTDIPSWVVSYRPSSVDFVYTMATPATFFDDWTFYIRDANGSTIGSTNVVSNGIGTFTVNVTLSFNGATAGDDINEMEVESFAYAVTMTLDGVCFLP